jgi:phosphoribosylamine--glycine ligase
VRFLGVGESCDLGFMYHRLARDGHEVKVYISDPRCRETLDGIIEKSNALENRSGMGRSSGHGVV